MTLKDTPCLVDQPTLLHQQKCGASNRYTLRQTEDALTGANATDVNRFEHNRL